MASDEIRELQTTRDKLRAQARCSGTDEIWTSFRAARNRIKAVIEKAKRAFLSTALSKSDLRRFGGLSIELFTLAPGPLVQILIS